MKRKTKKNNGRLQNIRFILIAVILVASLTQIGWMNNQTDKEFVQSQFIRAIHFGRLPPPQQPIIRMYGVLFMPLWMPIISAIIRIFIPVRS